MKFSASSAGPPLLQRSRGGGIQSVKRFVRKLLGGPSKEACAVIETAVGEEAQVDYGTGPMVRDPQTGKTDAHDCSC